MKEKKSITLLNMECVGVYSSVSIDSVPTTVNKPSLADWCMEMCEDVKKRRAARRRHKH